MAEQKFPTEMIDLPSKGKLYPKDSPLKDGKIVLSGLRPDSQRYFEYHHAANDTFDAIN